MQRYYGHYNISRKSIKILLHGIILLPDAASYGPQREKTFFGGLQTSQAQTSLHICAV